MTGVHREDIIIWEIYSNLEGVFYGFTINFLVILILLNAYFAATEIAFISLNDAKIEKRLKRAIKKQNKFKKCSRIRASF